MSRKRERPNQSGNHFPKRRRPSILQSDTDDHSTSILGATSSAAGKQQKSVVVIGLPTDCSVLDLKSRFEIYGSISRTRIDPNGLAYITFRSQDSANSANSAVSAALDPSFRLTLLSKQVQVMWASDPVPKCSEGVAKNVGVSSWPLSSRLVRAEVPLSRRGRGNKLGSAIVNPRVKENNNNNNGIDINDEDDRGGRGVKVPALGLNEPFKGREIVAYDDIL